MKKSILSIILTLALIFTAIPSFASAASDQLGVFWRGSTNFKISIGSVYDSGRYSEKQAVKFDHKPGATYTATSDKSSVAKVTGVKVEYEAILYEDVGKVFVTGVSKGTANITLKETYKGKTKVVGKAKVSVVAADIGIYSNPKHEFGLGYQNSELKFINRADDATYDFKSNKPGLTLTVKDQVEGYKSIMMDATEYGEYVVTASETINGKTRKIKDIKFSIKPMVLPDSITVKTSSVFIEEHVKYYDMNYVYGFFIEGQQGFRRSGSSYEPFKPEGTGFSKNYKVFSVAYAKVEKIGDLIANKATTVTAEIYRIPAGSTDDSQLEHVKTVKVTFKF